MTQYNVGETKRIQCTFTNASGVASNPTTVQLRIGVQSSDDGTVTMLETYAAGDMQHPSTGVYYKDYTFEQAGRHVLEWSSTGTPTTLEIALVDVATEYEWV